MKGHFRLKRLSSASSFIVLLVPLLAGYSSTQSQAQCCGNEQPVVRATISRDEQISDRLRAEKARLYFGETDIKAGGEKKVIYGPDNRQDIYALSETNPLEKMAKQVASSTCLLTSKSRVSEDNAGYRLGLEDFRQFGLSPCSSERFRQQKAGGWCSGFLIGKDLVATAGHCCEPTDAEVQKTAFIFGFVATDENTVPQSLSKNQVYFGSKMIAHRLTEQGDFAIVQLDRPVDFSGAVPLSIRRAGEPTEELKIGVIGYPSGLPAKAAFGDTTKIYEVGEVWLRTNLDSYGGNSGSAVLNHEGVIEGILVRGTTDYKIHNNSCFYSNRLMESEAGEFVTRTSVFATSIPHGGAVDSDSQKAAKKEDKK